jgi:hypothetical protein
MERCRKLCWVLQISDFVTPVLLTPSQFEEQSYYALLLFFLGGLFFFFFFGYERGLAQHDCTTTTHMGFCWHFHHMYVRK